MGATAVLHAAAVIGGLAAWLLVFNLCLIAVARSQHGPTPTVAELDELENEEA